MSMKKLIPFIAIALVGCFTSKDEEDYRTVTLGSGDISHKGVDGSPVTGGEMSVCDFWEWYAKNPPIGCCKPNTEMWAEIKGKAYRIDTMFFAPPDGGLRLPANAESCALQDPPKTTSDSVLYTHENKWYPILKEIPADSAGKCQLLESTKEIFVSHDNKDWNFTNTHGWDSSKLPKDYFYNLNCSGPISRKSLLEPLR